MWILQVIGPLPKQEVENDYKGTCDWQHDCERSIIMTKRRGGGGGFKDVEELKGK